MEDFAACTIRALVPEHLEHYVRSVSSCTPLRVNDFLAWRAASTLILVGFPLEGAPLSADGGAPAVNSALARGLALPWVEEAVVLAPLSPDADGNVPLDLPPGWQTVSSHHDVYYGLELKDLKIRGKLANMLRRADALVDVSRDEPWGEEHEALTRAATAEMLGRSGERRLGEDGALLFRRVGAYVSGCPGKAVCHSARRRDTGALCGLAVSDHASYTSAFHLFAFRAGDAPPGTADALVRSIFEKAEELGQAKVNLGLAIHPGLRFYKEKWGASPLFPCAECRVRRQGFFSRLFGRGRTRGGRP